MHNHMENLEIQLVQRISIFKKGNLGLLTQNMSYLKEYTNKVEGVAKAVIEAKQTLWDQFQKRDYLRQVETYKGKKAKILRQLGDYRKKKVTTITATYMI